MRLVRSTKHRSSTPPSPPALLFIASLFVGSSDIRLSGALQAPINVASRDDIFPRPQTTNATDFGSIDASRRPQTAHEFEDVDANGAFSTPTRPLLRPTLPHLRPNTAGGTGSAQRILAELLAEIDGTKPKKPKGQGSKRALKKAKTPRCYRKTKKGRLEPIECGDPSSSTSDNGEDGSGDSSSVGLEELLAEVLDPNNNPSPSGSSSEEVTSSESSEESHESNSLREAQQRLLTRLQPIISHRRSTNKAKSVKKSLKRESISDEDDLSLDDLLELEGIPNGIRRKTKKKKTTVKARGGIDCIQEWSEWSPASICTKECGGCAKIIMRRACLSSPSCSCSGPDAKLELCNRQPCVFPRPSCCPDLAPLPQLDGTTLCSERTIASNTFSRQILPPLPETGVNVQPSLQPTVNPQANLVASQGFQPTQTQQTQCCAHPAGTWSSWRTIGACTDQCGGYGRVARRRICLSTPYGCPCYGNSDEAAALCNLRPCPYPQTSCASGLSVQFKGAIPLCLPQTYTPAANRPTGYINNSPIPNTSQQPIGPRYYNDPQVNANSQGYMGAYASRQAASMPYRSEAGWTNAESQSEAEAAYGYQRQQAAGKITQGAVISSLVESKGESGVQPSLQIPVEILTTNSPSNGASSTQRDLILPDLPESGSFFEQAASQMDGEGSIEKDFYVREQQNQPQKLLSTTPEEKEKGERDEPVKRRKRQAFVIQPRPAGYLTVGYLNRPNGGNTPIPGSVIPYNEVFGYTPDIDVYSNGDGVHSNGGIQAIIAPRNDEFEDRTGQAALVGIHPGQLEWREENQLKQLESANAKIALAQSIPLPLGVPSSLSTPIQSSDVGSVGVQAAQGSDGLTRTSSFVQLPGQARSFQVTRNRAVAIYPGYLVVNTISGDPTTADTRPVNPVLEAFQSRLASILTPIRPNSISALSSSNAVAGPQPGVPIRSQSSLADVQQRISNQLELNRNAFSAFASRSAFSGVSPVDVRASGLQQPKPSQQPPFLDSYLSNRGSGDAAVTGPLNDPMIGTQSDLVAGSRQFAFNDGGVYQPNDSYDDGQAYIQYTGPNFDTTSFPTTNNPNYDSLLPESLKFVGNETNNPLAESLIQSILDDIRQRDGSLATPDGASNTPENDVDGSYTYPNVAESRRKREIARLRRQVGDDDPGFYKASDSVLSTPLRTAEGQLVQAKPKNLSAEPSSDEIYTRRGLEFLRQLSKLRPLGREEGETGSLKFWDGLKFPQEGVVDVSIGQRRDLERRKEAGSDEIYTQRGLEVLRQLFNKNLSAPEEVSIDLNRPQRNLTEAKERPGKDPTMENESLRSVNDPKNEEIRTKQGLEVFRQLFSTGLSAPEEVSTGPNKLQVRINEAVNGSGQYAPIENKSLSSVNDAKNEEIYTKQGLEVLGSLFKSGLSALREKDKGDNGKVIATKRAPPIRPTVNPSRVGQLQLQHQYRQYAQSVRNRIGLLQRAQLQRQLGGSRLQPLREFRPALGIADLARLGQLAVPVEADGDKMLNERISNPRDSLRRLLTDGKFVVPPGLGRGYLREEAAARSQRVTATTETVRTKGNAKSRSLSADNGLRSDALLGGIAFANNFVSHVDSANIQPITADSSSPLSPSSTTSLLLSRLQALSNPLRIIQSMSGSEKNLRLPERKGGVEPIIADESEYKGWKTDERRSNGDVKESPLNLLLLNQIRQARQAEAEAVRGAETALTSNGASQLTTNLLNAGLSDLENTRLEAEQIERERLTSDGDPWKKIHPELEGRRNSLGSSGALQAIIGDPRAALYNWRELLGNNRKVLADLGVGPLRAEKTQPKLLGDRINQNTGGGYISGKRLATTNLFIQNNRTNASVSDPQSLLAATILQRLQQQKTSISRTTKVAEDTAVKNLNPDIFPPIDVPLHPYIGPLPAPSSYQLLTLRPSSQTPISHPLVSPEPTRPSGLSEAVLVRQIQPGVYEIVDDESQTRPNKDTRGINLGESDVKEGEIAISGAKNVLNEGPVPPIEALTTGLSEAVGAAPFYPRSSTTINVKPIVPDDSVNHSNKRGKVSFRGQLSAQQLQMLQQIFQSPDTQAGQPTSSISSQQLVQLLQPFLQTPQNRPQPPQPSQTALNLALLARLLAITNQQQQLAAAQSSNFAAAGGSIPLVFQTPRGPVLIQTGALTPLSQTVQIPTAPNQSPGGFVNLQSTFGGRPSSGIGQRPGVNTAFGSFGSAPRPRPPPSPEGIVRQMRGSETERYVGLLPGYGVPYPIPIYTQPRPSPPPLQPLFGPNIPSNQQEESLLPRSGILQNPPPAFTRCCVTGGIWDLWSEWSQCSAQCGACGTRSRRRECASAAQGCPCFSDPQLSSQTELCNRTPCGRDAYAGGNNPQFDANETPQQPCCGGLQPRLLSDGVNSICG